MANLITLTDPKSAAAEAYRALRVNLAFTSLDKPLEALVVSAPALDETKSSAAANLAVVAAQAGQKVALVDGDLRRPCLHELFGVAQEPGVTNVLLSHEAMGDLPLVQTQVEGLWLLPSGALPPNPADIVGSQKMAQLLAKLQAQVNLVIVDAPPVTVAVDAAALAARTDGLLLIIRAGHTRRDRIEQAKSLLERFEARLLGAVFTDSTEGGLLTGY